MLTEVLFLSLREMQALEPDACTAVISILDHSEAHERPTSLPAFKDHLVLEFEDTSEEVYSLPAWAWPDELTPEEHLLATMGVGERAPELKDAECIVAFVTKHVRSPAPTTLVVHCHGGISRSAAVAEWVGAVHRIVLPQLGTGEKCTDGANRRLLRLLNKAAGRV